MLLLSLRRSVMVPLGSFISFNGVCSEVFHHLIDFFLSFFLSFSCEYIKEDPTVAITVYLDGFKIDKGDIFFPLSFLSFLIDVYSGLFRPFSDPSNSEFVNCLKRGFALSIFFLFTFLLFKSWCLHTPICVVSRFHI